MTDLHQLCHAAYRSRRRVQGVCRCFDELTHTLGPARSDICAICQEKILDQERTITHSDGSCENAAHERCMTTWVDVRETCPFCRLTLDLTGEGRFAKIAASTSPQIVLSDVERENFIAFNGDELLRSRLALLAQCAQLVQFRKVMIDERSRLIREQQSFRATFERAFRDENAPNALLEAFETHDSTYDLLIYKIDVEGDCCQNAIDAISTAIDNLRTANDALPTSAQIRMRNSLR